MKVICVTSMASDRVMNKITKGWQRWQIRWYRLMSGNKLCYTAWGKPNVQLSCHTYQKQGSTAMILNKLLKEAFQNWNHGTQYELTEIPITIIKKERKKLQKVRTMQNVLWSPPAPNVHLERGRQHILASNFKKSVYRRQKTSWGCSVVSFPVCLLQAIYLD